MLRKQVNHHLDRVWRNVEANLSPMPSVMNKTILCLNSGRAGGVISHLPFSLSEQKNLPELLFVYLPQALSFFLHHYTWKKGGHAQNEEKVKEMIRHNSTWYGQTHSHAISLITSDREGAQGSDYSQGHFRCSAPLATCPIYAFTKHMNGAHTQECVSKHTFSHKSSFSCMGPK